MLPRRPAIYYTDLSNVFPLYTYVRLHTDITYAYRNMLKKGLSYCTHIARQLRIQYVEGANIVIP